MRSYLEENSGKIIFVIFYLSLFVSFIFNLDSAGSGGHKADFYGTWDYVEVLTQHFFATPSQYGLDLTPLSFMILSWFNYFFNDKFRNQFTRKCLDLG